MKLIIFLIGFLSLFAFNQKVSGQAKSLANFSEKITGSNLEIEMILVPGGIFNMGSNVIENESEEDERPVHKVKIEPFWMSKYEITWDLYYLFLNREIDNYKNEDKDREVQTDIDAVSSATIPYVDMSLGMGTTGYPVANVTQLAASKFCEWLSAKTGHFFRLPTEAEWEYACRAGTETSYSFGNDDNLLDEYAWYYENSDDRYHKGGLKKPNPWGFYDMHGNVAEWTLDQYLPNSYSEYMNGVADNPFEVPTKEYPRSLRGGSWDDDGDKLRSASRQGSNSNWKKRDPQLPKSLWWYTDAPFLGFRIIRTVETPKNDEFTKYWGLKVPKKG